MSSSPFASSAFDLECRLLYVRFCLVVDVGDESYDVDDDDVVGVTFGLLPRLIGGVCCDGIVRGVDCDRCGVRDFLPLCCASMRSAFMVHAYCQYASSSGAQCCCPVLLHSSRIPSAS